MTLSQKKRQKIIEYWNSGLTVPAIAKIMNQWENTIRNILRKEGLYPRLYTPSGYAQQGAQKIITFHHGNQPWQLPTPQQSYQQQIAAEQGPKLIYEFDKRNREHEDLNQKVLQVTTEKEKLQDKDDTVIDVFGKIEGPVREIFKENATQSKTINKLTAELNTANAIKDQQKIELDTIKLQLQQKDKKIDSDRIELESLKQKNRENEQIKGELDTARQEINRLREELGIYKGILHEKIEQINDLKQQHLKENQIILKDISEIKTTINTGFNTIKEKFKTVEHKVFEENKNLTEKVSRLTIDLQHQKDHNMADIVHDLTGAAVYLGTMWCLVELNKSQRTPPLNSGNNTNVQYSSTISQQSGITQPHGQPITYANVQQNIDTIEHLSFGASDVNCRGQHQSGLEVMSPRQDTVIQTDPNPVTIVTGISSVQNSGVYASSHNDAIGFTSPVVNFGYSPSAVQVPFIYPYMSLPSHLPEDLSEVFPMNKWRRLTGPGFETCIEKLFIHKGGPTERLPYGNIAGDMIVPYNCKPTLAECKQTPTVGVETIQRTRGAMEHYRSRGVTHCMVITTGEFTKNAIEEAQKIGVTLWDGKRLLEEIYKAQFFYVPTEASAYDPNK